LQTAERRTPVDIHDLSYEDLVKQLSAVSRKLMSWTYGQGESVLREYKAEARLIGEELNRRGGMELMLRAHGDSGGGRTLDRFWDGIGRWQG